MDSTYIPTIASQSLGRAWHHRLEDKLVACASYGFRAIELFMEDLHYVAKSLPDAWPAHPAGTTFPGSSRWQEQQLAAADYIHFLCVQQHLEILCLQPFMHYDGLMNEAAHQSRISELHFWIRLAKRVHTDLIQIPSSFLPESQCTGDRSKIVADLREAAEVGLSHTPAIRFAYEALCWGTHIDRWDQAWEVVRAVDRANVGTCLDTFNIAARVYADPTTRTGRNATAEWDMRRSIEKITDSLDVSKVFYVEVCDGERLDRPLTPEHEWYNPDQPARMTWSRNARLFPFEKNGYLPVLDIFDAIVDRGYRGHVSFEVFSRTCNTDEPGLPETLARRGAVSWARLMDHLASRSTSPSNGSLSPSPRQIQNQPTTSTSTSTSTSIPASAPWREAPQVHEVARL